MKLISLSCPNCGGELEIEDGIDTFYCKYCGHTIIMTELSDEYVKAKTKLKREEIRADVKQKFFAHVERQTQTKAKQEKLRLEHKERESTRKHRTELSRNNTTSLIIVAVVLLLLLERGGLFNISSRLREKKLNKITAQIEEYIGEGNYDSARQEALKLNENASVTSWKDAASYYSDLIDEKEMEALLNDPDVAFAPISSKSVKGKNYEETVALFKNAGFINVETSSVEETRIVLKRTGEVEHVSIGSVIDFTTEDHFDAGTKVVIYYYE